VEAGVAAAVLAAALLHATWHALVKSSGDRVVALAGMGLVSGAFAVAALPFVAAPPAPVLAVIACSVLLHIGYKLALAHLYEKTDLSRAYPLARGITPVLAALLAFAFLSEIPSATTLAGVAAISLGIGGLVFERGVSVLSVSAAASAVAAGAAVAAYSALDAYGVRLNGDWLSFTAWLVACDSGLFVAYALATRRRAAAASWRSEWGRTLVSGLLGSIAFAVFLWALSRAQVGAVSALRETSMVFSVLIGALALKERMTGARAFAVAMVLGGTAAIALAR
jgi:drug/metabolite transporter (DMT)-like permease